MTHLHQSLLFLKCHQNLLGMQHRGRGMGELRKAMSNSPCLCSRRKAADHKGKTFDGHESEKSHWNMLLKTWFPWLTTARLHYTKFLRHQAERELLHTAEFTFRSGHAERATNTCGWGFSFLQALNPQSLICGITPVVPPRLSILTPDRPNRLLVTKRRQEAQMG